MKSELLRFTAHTFNLSPDEIAGRVRKWRLMPARFALYKALRMRGWTYGQIALFLDRDHSTIIYGVSRAEAMMQRDRVYARQVAAIAEYRPAPMIDEAA